MVPANGTLLAILFDRKAKMMRMRKRRLEGGRDGWTEGRREEEREE